MIIDKWEIVAIVDTRHVSRGERGRVGEVENGCCSQEPKCTKRVSNYNYGFCREE